MSTTISNGSGVEMRLGAGDVATVADCVLQGSYGNLLSFSALHVIMTGRADTTPA